jgi:hypothetical protein
VRRGAKPRANPQDAKNKGDMTMSKILGAVLVALVFASGAWAQITKVDSDAAAAGATSEVVFGARDGQLVVKSLYAKSGAATDTLALYVRNTADATNPYTVTATTEGTNIVLITNPAVSGGHSVTNGDVVVLQWPDGTVQKAAVTASSATSATITPASVKAIATGTKLYDLSSAGTILIGSTAFSQSGDAIYATPVNSPLWIQATGTNGNYLIVTVQP